MALFEVGKCRVCGKNCLWMPIVDGILAFFDVCSDECLANCEEAQQCLHPTDGRLSASDNESTPATIGG